LPTLNYAISLAKPSQQRVALRLSLTDGRLSDVERECHVSAFIEYARAMSWNLDRQWLMHRDNCPVWACTSIASPGASTILTLPHPATVEPEQISRALGCVIDEETGRGIQIVQALILPEDTTNCTALLAAGFREIALLDYLELSLRGMATGAPDQAPPGGRWRHYDASTHAAFREVIANSYRGSLDCPQLTGLRCVEDAIAGHKSAGRFEPENWHLLAIDERPAACVLFGRSPIHPAAELVYMGLDPDYRGRGIGRYVLDYGLRSVRETGCQTVTLAVDVNNVPAIRLYEQAGFRRTHLRRAMVYCASTCA